MTWPKRYSLASSHAARQAPVAGPSRAAATRDRYIREIQQCAIEILRAERDRHSWGAEGLAERVANEVAIQKRWNHGRLSSRNVIEITAEMHTKAPANQRRAEHELAQHERRLLKLLAGALHADVEAHDVADAAGLTLEKLAQLVVPQRD